MSVRVNCLLLFAILCLTPRTYSAELVVSIEIIVEPQEGFLQQIVVDGRTNLPPFTELSISINEYVTDETRGSTETQILSDGAFKSEPLGPEEGLPPGKYLAEVRAQFTKWQPESVREIVGESGERLTGPLLEKDRSHGTIVATTKVFTIGGEDAEHVQWQRFEKELKSMEVFQQSINALHQRLIREPTLAPTDEFLVEVRKSGGQISSLLTTQKARIHAKYLVAMLESICSSARIRRPELVQQGHKNFVAGLVDWNNFRQGFEKKLANSGDTAAQPTLIRHWRSADGKFDVDAKLIKAGDNEVTLERRDGKRVRVQIKKLSPQDQDFLREHSRTHSRSNPSPARSPENISK